MVPHGMWKLFGITGGTKEGEGPAMKGVISAAVVAAVMAGGAAAGPFEDGLAAYDRDDFGAAFGLWRPLAERGDAAAQLNLGIMYSRGEGIAEDRAAAAHHWFGLAAEQGLAEAEYSLGVSYEFGEGIPEDDPVEAAKWFEKAAEQDYPAAQYRLGLLYSKGLGVSQDFVLAHMWLNLAAGQGDKAAVQKRDTLADRMTADQLAEAQRLAREWKQGPQPKPEHQQESEQGPAAKQDSVGNSPNRDTRNVTIIVVNSERAGSDDARLVYRVQRPSPPDDCGQPGIFRDRLGQRLVKYDCLRGTPHHVRRQQRRAHKLSPAMAAGRRGSY